MITLIYAHPYPDRSRANRILLDAARDVPGVAVRVLHDLYPDFAIDIDAEQAALRASHAVIWQHPIYWYGPPALLKLWFDKVLALGFAYGPGGRALEGKRCLWAATTGGDLDAYHQEGMHAHHFDAFVPPIRQTARFCAMHWEAPFVLHGVRQLDDVALAAAAAAYHQRVSALASAGEVAP
jgi:glutathione-regulated potassium-efflux system ancillary protein KefF